MSISITLDRLEKSIRKKHDMSYTEWLSYKESILAARADGAMVEITMTPPDEPKIVLVFPSKNQSSKVY